ncbi:hypothetical protein EOD39_9183 [Acipenser ruthenus]|uniref:Uncharacterized protein n=1 Tax=Acipenser ruthenus TaxID=7906 RepID=A0A444U1I2_ACIRT|nr:hypothetical protein EOD39_9183 [Acipenser ruthenus]
MDCNKQEFVDFVSSLKKLNELNASLQGKNTHILMLSDCINGFMIIFWRQNLMKENYESFTQLCTTLTDNNSIQPPTQVQSPRDNTLWATPAEAVMCRENDRLCAKVI